MDQEKVPELNNVAMQVSKGMALTANFIADKIGRPLTADEAVSGTAAAMHAAMVATGVSEFTLYMPGHQQKLVIRIEDNGNG